MKIVSVAKAAPVAAVIERCRELLARAESGELRSIMWIAELANGSREAGYSACEDLFKLLAEAHRLAHRIQRRIDGQ